LTDPVNDRPLAGPDDLLAPFHAAMKPRAAWRVGTEAEKFGVYLADGSPIPFDGERGVAAILRALAERFGWTPEAPEKSGEPVLALRRDGASITLEPGGQLELSGAPKETIHETAAEFAEHMDELRGISAELGIAWLGLGFHPLARREELPWVPKPRYPIMRAYLPTRGQYGLDMMQRTATVQANYDYASADDAMRKLRVALILSPVLQAMFANSPFVEGRATGERTHRGAVWLDVDHDRAGLLPFAWKDGATIEDYVAWALDVPMFLVKRDGVVKRATTHTFRRFLAEGFEGAQATHADWETHLNTLFPEVRLKRTLETRSADSQQRETLAALPAVFTGIYYDDAALARAESLASRIPYDAAVAARPHIAREGLRATLAGRPVGEWASELFAIAKDGLAARARRDPEGNDETVHLRHLGELLAAGQTPADALLARLDPDAPLPAQILTLARI
jgi:glutamate--cysteine ligase